MHAFDWEYKTVEAKATEIADIGYKAVLVALPLKSDSDCVWYKRYQPQDLRVIDQCRGNKEDFVVVNYVVIVSRALCFLIFCYIFRKLTKG